MVNSFANVKASSFLTAYFFSFIVFSFLHSWRTKNRRESNLARQTGEEVSSWILISLKERFSIGAYVVGVFAPYSPDEQLSIWLYLKTWMKRVNTLGVNVPDSLIVCGATTVLKLACENNLASNESIACFPSPFSSALPIFSIVVTLVLSSSAEWLWLLGRSAEQSLCHSRRVVLLENVSRRCGLNDSCRHKNCPPPTTSLCKNYNQIHDLWRTWQQRTTSGEK